MDKTEEIAALLDERGVKYALDVLSNHRSEFSLAPCEECGDYLTRIHVIGSCISTERSYLTPEEAVDVAVGPLITEDTSDGWHSFKDLYHHRALLFSVIVHTYRDMCWKSKKHHDGKELDWNFIVGIDTPWGQASYHYGMEYWDLFDCKEVEQAPFYDGYTADESVARIAKLVELDTTVGAGTCHDTDENPVRFTCHNVAPEYLDFLCSECGFVHYHSDENDDGEGNDWKYCPNCGAEVVV